jgi:hypothetical protein
MDTYLKNPNHIIVRSNIITLKRIDNKIDNIIKLIETNNCTQKIDMILPCANLVVSVGMFIYLIIRDNGGMP